MGDVWLAGGTALALVRVDRQVEGPAHRLQVGRRARPADGSQQRGSEAFEVDDIGGPLDRTIGRQSDRAPLARADRRRSDPG
jgi:hypothetical protein